MRERINRLAKGIIDTEVPLLVIQPSKLLETVEEGQVTKREIFVTSENALHIKGLAYSSNARVQIGNSAFGGQRNHIAFEIDSRYLEYGDQIEGMIYLVTNGGEMEVPFSFRVEARDSGKILGRLKTPNDFAAIAKNDFEMALRLFEYQDFTEIPFMQDLHVRALYDGLKGRGSRPAALEEFLIAVKAKSPVKLFVPAEPKHYDNPETIVEDEIEIRKEGWGYLPITVKADGMFIQLSQKQITNQDFEEDICRFSFQIVPSKLHGGKNFGSISLSTASETVVIKIQVFSRQAKTSGMTQARYARYLSLRLEYECQSYEPALLMNQMLEEMDQLHLVGTEDEILLLATAELYALAGRTEAAREILEKCRPGIMEDRQEHMDLYCLLQYITLLVEPDEQQKASLIRLLHKYLDEGNAKDLFFFLAMKLEDGRLRDPSEQLAQMKDLYRSGTHSPFLYLQAARIFNEVPETLYRVGSFEIQVLYFACRKGMVTEDLAVKSARLASVTKHYNGLYVRFLRLLYDKYPRREVLEAVCAMLIKGDRRNEMDFTWYERALKAQLSLTRLYEYYLYSLPKDYRQLIPKEVLLYFSYDHDLDVRSKSVLYQNILTYMNADLPLYQEYERVISKFATDQIFNSKIDRSLAVIYDHMIYKDMIDPSIARVLPGILRAYRISCNHKDMKYAVVCYEELVEEGIYNLEDGVTYAPLFSDHSLVLFQDAYGNRYGETGYVKIPVLQKPELEQRCFEVFPNHPMMLLSACRACAEKESLEEEDAQLLERALSELKLHPLYKKVLTSKLVEHYSKRAESDPESGMVSSYLLALDKRGLKKEQRIAVCETLISQNYMKEAYEMIREYGQEGISQKRLLKLCTKMILEKLFDQDELLLKLAYLVFEDEKNDSVILDYLCEYFNGTSEQMYRVLKQGVLDHVETYDLEERLLAQMLFSDQTEKLDQVFSLYTTRKKTSESIVKAYFTMKSSGYFLHDMAADDQVFAYLEGMINGTIEKDRLSTIYLLALTKYYSTLPVLEEDQKRMCQNMVNILLAEGMVFPHFKNLAEHISIPDDILDKGIIQYIGQKDSNVDLQIRILPDEERYHSDDMKRVYQGIFVKQKVLFEGEILEYQIYEQRGEARLLMKEGSVTCQLPRSSAGESRFSCLNQMSLCLGLKEEDGLKKTMKEYLMKTATVEELFELM